MAGARRLKDRLLAAGDRRVVRGIERLVLSSRVREYGALRREVKFRNRPRAARFAAMLIAWFYAPERLGRIDLGVWRRRLYHGAALLSLRLIATKGRLRPALEGFTAVAAQRVQRHAELAAPVAVDVATPDETNLVRQALLLRCLGRHGAAVDLLLARNGSGQPSAWSRFWLAFLMREIGEEKIGALIVAGADTPAHPRSVAAPGAVSAAAVVLSMFDSPVFRASLTTLSNSDFTGELIVVEDGDHEGRRCEAFCRQRGIAYHRTAGWVGSSAAVNAGIERLKARPDVVIFAHNDVLWPERWWPHVAATWERAGVAGRIGLLNLSYLQIGPSPERTLAELFRQGAYGDLAWLLMQLRTAPAWAAHIEQALVEGEGHLGLSRDVWNDRPDERKQMTGRFSVASSFPLALWESMGRFDPGLIYGCDLQLQYECLRRRLWMLWVDNPPLIHFVSSDTKSLDRARRDQFADKLGETYTAFKAKYGFTIQDFLAGYFGGTSVVHRETIVKAVNEGRFEDIEFVFDDFWRRFENPLERPA